MTAAEKLKKAHGAFTCLALVKPRSNLADEWALSKPGYCIFEYIPAFAVVVIRWGDGSWHELTDATQLDDLILLREFGEAEIDRLFN